MSRLEELRKREESALMPGGPDSVKAQHKAGKKTARERISALLDAASFVEIDKFVRRGYTTPGFESVSAPGEGVVCGYGTISERPVFIFAQDYTVLSGSVSVAHAQKILKTIDMAATSGLPVIGILDSGGSRIAEGVGAIDAYAAILKKLNEVSGVIPTISVIAGMCVGTAAYLAASTDFCFATDKISTLGLHGPQIYASTLGDAIDVKEALSAKAANETMGVAQFLCETEDACVQGVRALLDYLPSNNLEESPYVESGDSLNRKVEGFEDAYDPKALIAAVCDDGKCLEYQALFGKEIVTAFGHLNGAVVGFVANAADGIMTGDAARKAARFVSILDAYNIPVVTFTNCEGTQVTPDEPASIRDCSSLISAYAACGCPLLNVIAGKAVGAGFAMMCPKSLGADIVYAWPQAVITAMPPEAGGIIAYEDDIKKAPDGIAAKQEAIEKYEKEFANPWQAAEQGVVDDVIDPAATRQMLIAALEMCLTKRVTKMPRKHGVPAL